MDDFDELRSKCVTCRYASTGNLDPACLICRNITYMRDNPSWYLPFRERAQRERQRRRLVKRDDNGRSTDRTPGGDCPDPRMRTVCPTVCAYMGDSKWDDGGSRETSTVTVFLEGGGIKLALNDRDGLRSLYVTGDSLYDAFAAMERQLTSGDADWRKWKGKGKK